MDFKVVMTVEFPGIPPDEDIFRLQGAKFSKIPCRSEEEIIAAAHDADAIITIATVQSFPRKVIEKLDRCRIISSIGIGYEGIEVGAATDHGIMVVNTPDYCLEEVSDHAMALILACARKLLPQDQAVRAGKWNSLERPDIRFKIWPPMSRLKGQTLGLIGFGRIPRTLVPKAKGFGLKIMAYDPYVSTNIAKDLEVELVDLTYLLQHSDFISIHAALTPETKHMLGLEQFKQMKPTAYLINTARGGIIDEQALYQALSQGYIAGAGLDVLDPEPPPHDNPLFKLSNVIITAHAAHYSDQSVLELRRRPVEEIIRVLKGEWPLGLVNPEVKEAYLRKWKNLRNMV
jgi:D-3-phosphoglycerate dehydrogenase